MESNVEKVIELYKNKNNPIQISKLLKIPRSQVLNYLVIGASQGKIEEPISKFYSDAMYDIKLGHVGRKLVNARTQKEDAKDNSKGALESDEEIEAEIKKRKKQNELEKKIFELYEMGTYPTEIASALGLKYYDVYDSIIRMIKEYKMKSVDFLRYNKTFNKLKLKKSQEGIHITKEVLKREELTIYPAVLLDLSDIYYILFCNALRSGKIEDAQYYKNSVTRTITDSINCNRNESETNKMKRKKIRTEEEIKNEEIRNRVANTKAKGFKIDLVSIAKQYNVKIARVKLITGEDNIEDREMNNIQIER